MADRSRLAPRPIVADKMVTYQQDADDVTPLIDVQPATLDGQALALLRKAFDHGDLTTIEPDDVHEKARAYPSERVDPGKPVSHDALVLASAMVELFHHDRDAYKLALTTAAKKAFFEHNKGLFDTKAAGLAASAVADTAGARRGTMPARIIYRIRDATTWERWRYWGRDKWASGWRPRWLRLGPSEVGEDVSLWYIARSSWHYMRITESGIPQTSARPDIPCDMPPEHTMGDDWTVIERVPLPNHKRRGLSMVRTDIDMLAVTMGFRTGLGGLILPDLLTMMLDSKQANRKVENKGKGKNTRGQSEPAKRRGLLARWGLGLIKGLGVLGVMIAFAWAAITFT